MSHKLSEQLHKLGPSQRLLTTKSVLWSTFTPSDFLMVNAHSIALFLMVNCHPITLFLMVNSNPIALSYDELSPHGSFSW